MSSTNKNNLTADESLIYNIIARHQGLDNAVCTDAIVKRTGFNIRFVRKLIKQLIENHHKPIAATTKSPYGYYIPLTAGEVLEYKNNLKARMKSLANRLRAFDAAMNSTLFKQPTIFDTKPEETTA